MFAVLVVSKLAGIYWARRIVFILKSSVYHGLSLFSVVPARALSFVLIVLPVSSVASLDQTSWCSASMVWMVALSV